MFPRRYLQRGVTLIEVAAVTAGIGIITLGTSTFINLRSDTDHAEDAIRNAAVIQDAAGSYRSEHRNGCPSISELIHEKHLPASAQVEDPWGERFRVRCSGEALQVQSAGRDRQFGTDDDLSPPVR